MDTVAGVTGSQEASMRPQRRRTARLVAALLVAYPAATAEVVAKAAPVNRPGVAAVATAAPCPAGYLAPRADRPQV